MVIKSYEDYLYYLNCDKYSLGHNGKKPQIIGDLKNEIWKFERLLRKCKFYKNCKGYFKQINIFTVKI
jgi:serine O-acetyltransferase